jgi:hypothetical protein
MDLVLLVALVALRFVLAPDLSGVWNLDMHWLASNTKSTGVCTLKQDETKLTGSCQSAKSVVSGEVNDRKLTIRIDVEQDGQKGAMTFEGTVDESGSLIQGTCKIAGGQDGTFTMRKQ